MTRSTGAGGSGRGPGEDFSWHPEPELIGVRDAQRSRPALKALGAASWDTALDYLYDHGFERSMGEPTRYEDARAAFFGPTGQPAAAPVEPTTSDAMLAEFRERLSPHQLNAWYPTSMAYFTPAPLWSSIVGELLSQVIHQGIDVWHSGPSGALVEEEVVRWLCDLIGYGERSFGLFTSGGVMANIMATNVARDVHLGPLLGLDHPPRGSELEGTRLYVSDQAHFSFRRALSVLGFPTETLVAVPADDKFRLQAAPVAAAIARDRAAGLMPWAIMGTAGTTNTGSVDALAELADLAEGNGLWFHIDAAYGGAARLSERDAERVPALDRADSVTIDPHKWFFQAYDIGGLLLKEGSHLETTFSYRPEYYRGSGAADRPPDAHGSGELDFYRMSIEGTRRFRALKLWLSWKHLGTHGLGKLVEMNNDIAAALSRELADSADFELSLQRPELSVVCFRHLPHGRDAADQPSRDALDVHQDALQGALERSGRGFITTTRLNGRTWLRAGVLNYMATEADMSIFLDDLRALANG